MTASSASSGIANQDPDHERNGDQEKKCDGGKEKKRRGDEDKKRGAPNDGIQQPKRTKRRRLLNPIGPCPCDCYNENDSDTATMIVTEELRPGSQRCRCTLCGPIQPGGGRRCVTTLNSGGVAISRMMDGRVICFDCRGCDD